jgi:phospholipid-translocating ATPase
VVWTSVYGKAFEGLKEHICLDLVLRSTDFGKPYILQTDASNRGVGEVLSQIDDNGEEHPVVYFSRKLLEREEKYSPIERNAWLSN